MDTQRSFGTWLKERRAGLRLTQRELGEQAHCSTYSIRAYESERRRPSAEVVRALAHALHVPPESCPDLVAWVRTGRAPRDLCRLLGSAPDIDSSHVGPAGTPPPPAPDTRSTEAPLGVSPRTSAWLIVSPSAVRFLMLIPCLIALMPSIVMAIVLVKPGPQSSPTPPPPTVPMSANRPEGPRATLAPARSRLGGLWVSPANGAEIDLSRGPIPLVARAYTASSTDPPVARVEFTVSFPPGEWQIACVAQTPVREVAFPRDNGIQDTSQNDPRLTLTTDGELMVFSINPGDVFSCLWDVSMIISHDKQNGDFRADVNITFNVFDPRGDRVNAPHGRRTIRRGNRAP